MLVTKHLETERYTIFSCETCSKDYAFHNVRQSEDIRRLKATRFECDPCQTADLRKRYQKEERRD